MLILQSSELEDVSTLDNSQSDLNATRRQHKQTKVVATYQKCIFLITWNLE